MKERYDAVVIGAGANGLVAAAVLGKAGKRVALLEQSDGPGGQAASIELAPGFRAAPLGQDPGWLPPGVIKELALSPPELAYADPSITVAGGPGLFLSLAGDPNPAADTIRKHSASDAAKWPEFTTRLRAMAEFFETLYQVPPPDIDSTAPRDLLTMLDVGLRFRGLGREGMTDLLRTMPMSVQELLDDWFENALLKAAVAAGGVRDIRQGPRSGGTSFVLLHHLVGARAGSVRSRGWWRDGPEAITRVLEKAARRHGVTIRTGGRVSQIVVKEDAVTGVVLADGEEIPAPLVLSSAGPSRTLLGLVDPRWLDPEFLHAVRNIKYRGCTAFVLYALDALPEVPGVSEQALAGTVSLTSTLDALERSYDAAKYGRISERPHVEITVPTLRWPADAPNGKHVLVARAQYAPYRLRDDVSWDSCQRDALVERVTNAIEDALPGFGSRVLHREALAPPDLERRFGLSEGASSHGELSLDQILFMRPVAGAGGYAMPIRGLYLCGAGAHPGPGILGGPGLLAARQALRA